MTARVKVDPFSASGVHGRTEAYAVLAASGPVQSVDLPSGRPAWLVTGHAEVRQVLTDARLVKAPTPAGAMVLAALPEVAPGLSKHMLACDGEDHARLRRLVGAAFTSRRIAALEPRIRQITDDLLDALEASTPDGVAVDLVAEFAYPLPMTVICELIGVPESSPGCAATRPCCQARSRSFCASTAPSR